MCKGQVNFDPTQDWKTRCGDHFRPHAAISTFSNHSLYFKLDVGRVEMLWYSWTNHTYTILVWKVGYWSLSCRHPRLKSQGVVMVVDDEFKSQPCKTIHYTYNETLEGLRCCELPESVQTHSILVWKVGKGQAISDPTHDWKTRCGDHCRPHRAISPSPTIYYTYN